MYMLHICPASAASAPWTLHRAATSGTMPRLEPETGDTDWGLWQEHLPRVFLKLSQVGFNYLYSSTFWSVLCRCYCPLLKAALVSTKVLSEILTQEYDNNILTKWLISNFFFQLSVLQRIWGWLNFFEDISGFKCCGYLTRTSKSS